MSVSSRSEHAAVDSAIPADKAAEEDDDLPEGETGLNKEGKSIGKRKGKGKGKGPKGAGGRVRPTHFLALPLSHPDLHTRVSALTASLLSASPPIPGLEASIIIPPNRLHLTLGVLALRTNPNPNSKSSSTVLPVSAAVEHLNALRPRILEALEGRRLEVTLDGVGVMQPRRGEEERGEAHVMYVEPGEGEVGNGDVWTVGRLVYDSFREAGLVTETRPLKLHCTILNTSKRRPDPQKRARPGTPFSYSSVQQYIASTNAPTHFGTWAIDALELWVMGSFDAEGRYVRVGGVSLRPGDEDASGEAKTNYDKQEL